MEDRDKLRLLANLRSFPNELDDLVTGLTDDDLRWRPIPNKWSITEILCHLRDVEREVFQVRLGRALNEDTPTYELWDQDKAAWERSYLEQSGHAALNELRELRTQTADTLEGVSLEHWGRVGHHPERGSLSVEDQVVRQIRNHDLPHLIQMKDILRIKMPW